MLHAPPKTQAAFLALLAALDAEIQELQAVGQEKFHAQGLPRAARPLLQDAVQRARIRDDLAKLHAQWLNHTPPEPPSAPLPPPPPTETLKQEKRRINSQFSAMPGMTHGEAAKRLGVAPKKVLGWLKSGVLKGQQLTRTKWKIAGPDLVAFAREHRDLL